MIGHRIAARVIIAAAVTGTAACAPGPLSRPATATPMNAPVALGSEAPAGGMESTRRTLEGAWTLVALELAMPGQTARVPVVATGTLVYDEFGNLTIDARTTDPSAPVAAREVRQVSFKGRAVIDVVKHELKLMDMVGNVNPDEVLAPERRRRYELASGTLTLSSFDASGLVTAVATWRRQ